MIALDSSAIIELLRGTEKGKKIRQIIENEAVATTTITLNEVLIGVPTRHKTMIVNFLKTFQILPFDEESGYQSVTIEEHLTAKGKPIGKLDVFIAAVCLTHEIKLITTDKDFKNIDDLELILI